MEAKKRPVVISLLSGKGGVGKTAIIASVGKLLSAMGFKVLLIDTDLITHGLTFLIGFNKIKRGILEEYNNQKITEEYLEMKERGGTRIVKKITPPDKISANLDEMLLVLEDNIHFIQSTSEPNKKYSKQVYDEQLRINKLLEDIFKKVISENVYDYILIDTQAGSVPSTQITTKYTDKLVIVMEPDPVSMYTTQNLISELNTNLPIDTYNLINKLSIEEIKSYEAIKKYLILYRHLPPIPFDFEVRKAFMIRSIPVNSDNPNSFMFGLFSMLLELIPDKGELINKYKLSVEASTINPIKEKIDTLEKEIDTIRNEELKMDKYYMYQLNDKNKINSIKLITSSFLLLLVTSFMLYKYYFINIENNIFDALFLVVAIIMIIYNIIEYRNKRDEIYRTRLENKMNRESHKEMLRNRQMALYKELESYNNLLMTRTQNLLYTKSNDKRNTT